MNPPPADHNFTRWPTTRRDFLRQSSRGAALLAFARYAPSFLVNPAFAATPSPEKDRRVLVLVQLAGGNDGLNTVVPCSDDRYYRLRPTLSLKRDQVLRLTDDVGLHPACSALHQLYQAGQLAIVQNVGYPNPNRSHFRSTEIWETAGGSDETLPTGWLGRYLDHNCSGVTQSDPLAIHLTNDQPQSFASTDEHATFGLVNNGRTPRQRRDEVHLLEKLAQAEPLNASGSFLQHKLMDALVSEKKVQRILADYRAETEYPATAFADSLRNVAALIAAGLATRVYYVSLAGFDTHSNQAGQHQNLLRTLSTGLAAFQADLHAHKLADQVLTMTFSEFGRRPAENESRGTDHGTAAPLFMLGTKLRGGLHGVAPSLELARNQDLTFSTDFRQVYATVLEDWMQCPANAVFAQLQPKLPLL